ncbi:MAG: hypothetical protein KGS45_11045 [Planctomycetes bacterium]|nr:hypothetical protein [Planctomycetota bacterium]
MKTVCPIHTLASTFVALAAGAWCILSTPSVQAQPTPQPAPQPSSPNSTSSPTLPPTTDTAAPPSPQPALPACHINLRMPEKMRDILSNVLVRTELKPETQVRAFLKDADKKFATGDDLLRAAANHFQIDPKRLAELAEKWRHINCTHAPVPGYVVSDELLDPATGEPAQAIPVSPFAANVTLHVVLHELGHAVIREFDIMVLGNEENMADAFATHMLTEHFPDQALAAITARITSLMIEAGEVPRDQWTVRGEHDNDARRAYQIAALALAADRDKYISVAPLVGMAERDIARACDYGADIHRAWRRTLTPFLMPAGKTSREARIRADHATTAFIQAGQPSLESTIESALRRIDWHSQVTIEFAGGPGGAAWSRSSRTIKVNGDYLRRFINQGNQAQAEIAPKAP